MSFHPNPVNLAVYVEHHRQELLEQARQERLAKEAISTAPARRYERPGLTSSVAGRIRALAARWQRSTVVEPIELPQPAPGDAR